MKPVLNCLAMAALALATSACRPRTEVPVGPAPTSAGQPSAPPPAMGIPLPPTEAEIAALIEAALANDFARARQLLATNPALASARNERGDSALYVAAFRGNKAMAELLLAHRADPNPPPNHRGETPLSIAVELGFRQTAEILRNGGARTDERVRGAEIRAAVQRPQPDALIRLLAASPGCVDLRNALGNTALYIAAASTNFTAVTILLAHKADPNATNHGGGTPYSVARELGPSNIVAQLRAQGGVENRVTEGIGIRAVARGGLLSEAESILRTNAALATAVDDMQRTPLHEAAGASSPALVGLLLQHKAEVNARDYSGATPLHNAAGAGDEQTVKVLLDHGADPKARNRQLTTPLHIAATRGRSAVAAQLLAAGAEQGTKDNSGQTPLHLAAVAGHAPLVELLLDRGAAVSAPDSRGNTPLHGAASRNRPEIVKLLLAHKADPGARDNLGRTPLALAESLKLEETAKLLRDVTEKP
ncbi:MAG: hypothetical protein FJ386_05010 [Verrucomicrobia bacterium]|nr:hypothetical protein [Verrucomicrobiota bacterium]